MEVGLFHDRGKPVAFISSSHHFVGYKEKKGPKQVELQNPQEHFTLSPLPHKRTCVYISGPSGCGKTYFAMEFMINYSYLFPEQLKLIITPDPEDETIRKFSPHIQNLKILDLEDEELDEMLLEKDEDLHVSLFKNSCVFLDDLDGIIEDTLRKKIQKLKRLLLKIGRHYHISVVTSSHLIRNGRETREDIFEADYIVTFPNCGSTYFTDSFFATYFSKINQETMNQIRSSKSRWVISKMSYPQMIILEHFIKLLQ